MRSFALPLLILAILALESRRDARADIIVNAPDSAANLRLPDGSTNPASLAAAYNFSGLGSGFQSGNPGPWGELVAVNGSTAEYFITASHYAPDSITFTNAAGVKFTYAVAAAIANVGNSDLAVGRLVGPVDPSITPFELAQPVKVGDQLLLAGHGEGTPKAGFATVNGILTLTSLPSHARVLTMDYDPSRPLNAWVQPGDSGSGSFVLEADGTASLASIHLGYSGPPVAGQQSYGQDTDLTMQVGAIDGALAQLGASGGIEVHTVPEPSSLVLMAGMGAAAVFAVGRRRRVD